MESTELQGLIAGAVVSVITSILKRWVTLDKKMTALLVLAVSFIVASAFFMLGGSHTWEEYIQQITTVFGSSQILYWVVMKSMGLGDFIEGKKAEAK